jgi:hypothetical protein
MVSYFFLEEEFQMKDVEKHRIFICVKYVFLKMLQLRDNYEQDNVRITLL